MDSQKVLEETLNRVGYISADFKILEAQLSWAVMINFFGCTLSIIMLSCLSADLILSLAYPFSNKKKRVRIMEWVSILLSIMTTIYQYIYYETSTWQLFTLVGVWWSLIIVSFVMALFKIFANSISKKVIKIILMRTLLTTACFSIC